MGTSSLSVSVVNSIPQTVYLLGWNGTGPKGRKAK